VIVGGGMRKQPHAAAPRSPSPTDPALGAAASGASMPPVPLRPRRPKHHSASTLPTGYNRALELFEQYLYDPKFKGRDPRSNSEYNELRNTLLKTIPSDGKIPGATAENGATDVFGFLRNGPMALNNAFAKMRSGEVLVCMQGRHNAGDPNNDKYARPSSR